MTWLDRLLRRWRIRKALRHIGGTPRILDVGCGDGALLRAVADRAIFAVGMDPKLPSDSAAPNARLISGHFPDDLPDVGPFDIITLLATIEHMSAAEQTKVAHACGRLLAGGGIVIASVPSPWVDPIIDALKWLGLIDGLSFEQHYGFEPRKTPLLFSAAGLECVSRRRFQLGLNNLFVFRKP